MNDGFREVPYVEDGGTYSKDIEMDLKSCENDDIEQWIKKHIAAFDDFAACVTLHSDRQSLDDHCRLLFFDFDSTDLNLANLTIAFGYTEVGGCSDNRDEGDLEVEIEIEIDRETQTLTASATKPMERRSTRDEL